VISSCFLWIGGISWLVVALFGLSAVTGWVVAGALAAVALAAIGILSYEVRHAIDLPDDVDLELMEAETRDPLIDARPLASKLRAGRVAPVHAQS
jgi:hypothetical protein